MNDLLEQFLIECHELAETATRDLLALETAPQDQQRIDGAFRGFHTLKGAAGIVGFAAMGRVLHAAESVLDAIRTGHRPVSAELIGDCLACLDQVVRWLEETETKGDIPTVPDSAADALVARLAPPAAEASPAASDNAVAPPAAEPSPVAVAPPLPARDAGMDAADWLAPLLARHPSRRAAVRTALRYVPDADCFFRAEDPLALIARVPGILALDLEPAEPWPDLEEFSPFECNLIILVLSTAAPDAVAAVLQTAAGQLEIRPVGGSDGDTGLRLSPDARAVLEQQLLLAGNDEPAGFAGRLGSAAQVAEHVLKLAGWPQTPGTLAEAIAQSQRDQRGTAFVAALQALLEATPDALDHSPAHPSGHAVPVLMPDAGAPADPALADPAASGAAAELAPLTRTAQSLRVDAARIDALVNLTGELTVVKNAIGHSARLAQDGTNPDELMRRLKDQHALLDRLVAQLQRSVLGIRVLPLRHVFQHFPRLVREIGRDLNKSVRLVIEGQTTEADKATVEALFEPLLHALRNALDHGIEPADERLAAGKPAEATVQLSATRDGDTVIVEVTDDGRGIDVTKIRRRAAGLGMATEAVLAEMTDQAVTELIFSPGFSTAAAVTSVSGRGVGMDAVRAAVLRLGGRVTVASQPGAGTRVRITLPFTVMMLRVMTVEAGGQIFGIPIETVVETARVPRHRLHRLGAAEAIVQRGRSMPLIRLADLLDLPASSACSDADARIVVVSVAGHDDADQTAADQTGALEVDVLGERIDVMLKPLDGLLAGVKGFAGTAVLGDGRVLIVLDLRELL